MDTRPQLPSDGQLLVAARTGMAGAWDELVRRHGDAVGAVAKATHRFGHKKATARALDALHGQLIDSEIHPTDGIESPPAIESDVRAVRPRMISLLDGGIYGPATADQGDVSTERAELESLARAFAALPEPWQTALWHRTVELQPIAEFAPMLGRTPTETSAVVQRAEAGLFEGFLLDQRNGDDVDDACRPIIALLGGSLRSTLSAHEQRLVTHHVHSDEPCAACSRRLDVSRELNTLVPLAIVPQLTGLSVERYRDAVGIRPAVLGTPASDRRRTIAFAAAFAALLLIVGAGVVLVRGSLGTSDASPSTTSGDEAVDPSTTVGDDGSEESPTTTAETGATAATTTTTELALRPTVNGPENRVSIVFPEVAEPVGFAPTERPLAIELSSPGPVFAGGTGTIDIAATNSTASPIQTEAVLRVPSGVRFDELVAGDADCVDPIDDSASCTLTLPADSTTTLTVRFALTSAVVGQFIVESNLADEIAMPIAAVPRLVHSSVGNGRLITIGNTLMTCSESALECLDARNGVGDVVNRWDLPAEFIGSIPNLGWDNSSAASFDVGTGSIQAAYLFWSGDLNERTVAIPDDGSNAKVSLIGPNSDTPLEIVADRVRLGDRDATQYFGFADVTDIVKFLGPGDYLVGNVQSVEVQGSYAGWSMVIVTRDDELPRRAMTITSPFAWFSPEDTYSSELAVPAGTDQAAHLEVLAFEGERGFVPERVKIGNVVLGEEVFDSTIDGERDPAYDNNFGIDIDAYDLSIDAPDGTLPIEAISDQDGIRLAVLALAVDVE